VTRVGVFGWGVVAPRSPNIDAFAENLGRAASHARPRSGLSAAIRASSRLIATMLLLEYGVLGAIAGTVGAAGAVVLSWAVARYALDLPWEPAPLLTRLASTGERFNRSES